MIEHSLGKLKIISSASPADMDHFALPPGQPTPATGSLQAHTGSLAVSPPCLAIAKACSASSKAKRIASLAVSTSIVYLELKDVQVYTDK